MFTILSYENEVATVLASKRKVLVVDDEKNTREALDQIFRGAGYEPMTASDGVEAIEHVSNAAFDLVVADLKMPKLGGMKLLLSIRQRNPETKIIIVTAYGEPESFAETMDRGTFKYISKPFRKNEILDLAEEALSGR